MLNRLNRQYRVTIIIIRCMVILSLLCTLAVYHIVETNYFNLISDYRSTTPSNLKQNVVLKKLEGHVVSLNTEKSTFIFKAKNLKHKILVYYDDKERDTSLIEKAILNDQSFLKIELNMNERQFRETHNAYEFDYQKYLYANNIIGQYHLKSYEVINNGPKSIFAFFNSTRMKITYHIEKHLPPKVSEYFNALVLGDSSSLEAKESFRKLGIAHVFAISGMHFGLVYAFLYKLIKGPRGIKSMFVAGLLLCYWGLIGFSYSAGRAVFLVIYIEISRLLSRKIDVLSAVAFTNLILLLLFPSAVLAVSYQLSFIAYLLIAYVYQRIQQHRKFNKLWGSLYFVFFIQIMFIPIQLYYFNEVNLWAFLPNLILVPLISFLFPFFFLTPMLGGFINGIMEKCLYGVEFLADHMPLLLIQGQVFTPNQFRVILVGALSYLFYKALKIHQNSEKSLEVIAFKRVKMTLWFLLMSVMIVSGFNFSRSEIHFFDVGHGDSALIMDGRYHILIDAGDQYTDLSQMLLKRDIYKIDALVFSHAHSDHVGGLLNLVHALKINQIYCNEETYEVIKDDIPDSSEIVLVTSPLEIALEHSKMTLIPTVSADTNDNAIAVWYDSKAIKGIFLGDISGDVYEKLPSILSSLDFIKVSHHGSKTGLSRTFLDAHKAKYAIISHSEKYLMPNKDTMPQLEAYGIKVYETYNCGELVLNKKGILPYLKR